LVQALCSIRSERLLMEQMDYNLLFRWFVGLSVDEPVWDASTFSKNRDRLLASDIAAAVSDYDNISSKVTAPSNPVPGTHANMGHVGGDRLGVNVPPRGAG
jgi:hypothetical protein